MDSWLQTLADRLRSPWKWAIFDENTAQATEAQDLSDSEKQRRYRQTLRRRRIRTVCIKLFFNILFLFAWSFLTLNAKTYKWTTLLGGNFWIDFGVYAGVSACFPLFLFIGLIRHSILVSQVWFEVVWLLGVSGFDTFLIYRLGKNPPPAKAWSSSVFGDPYLAVSVVLYALTVTSLAFDLIFSLLWSCYVSRLAWRNLTEYPAIWLAHAADFPWAPPTPPHNDSRSSLQLLLGTPQKPPAHEFIPTGVKKWILGSTMFRRLGRFEPLSHSILRGCVALLFWIILLVYGIFYCVVNPISQFASPEGLPTRSLALDSHPTGTFGHISGFIALDVVPYSQHETKNGSWEWPAGTCNRIWNGINAIVTDPATGQETICAVQCGGVKFRNQDDMFFQVEARWDCGSIWDHLAYRSSAATLSKRPFVTVTWNSLSYPDKPLRSAGLLSVPATPNASNYSSIVAWETDFPREWKHGVTFNLTAGQSFEVDVGRRRLYTNRATFWDLIGIARSPDIFTTYPILSVNATNYPRPNRTEMKFYPAFGAYNDELFEEYLDYTVVSGLSATGGLQSSFESIFLLIFGRALVGGMLGSKLVNPFGAIASMLGRESYRDELLKDYEDIEHKDPAKRVNATCKFLHDYILDLNPLEIPEANTVPGSGKGLKQTILHVDGNGKLRYKQASVRGKAGWSWKDLVFLPFLPLAGGSSVELL